MKFNFTRFASFFVLAFALIITGCEENGSGTEFSPPSVTAPSSQEAVVGQSVDITFSISIEAGYQSASVAAENGDALITSEPETESASGDVVVSYTASSAGAGSVVLTVTDSDGETADATAVLSNVIEQTTFKVTKNITDDVTWESGNTFILTDRIAVEAGATLTIEGGTVVKGEAGSGENATALLVARDATLNANGTADAPIIFTTVADEITPEMVASGNFASPNLSTEQNGFWGGVIILGNAPISASNEPASIEGIPGTDENGLYGGDDPGDSSGSITYVTIRHGGSNIGEGNEINGLSLGGVGTGTTIENIEIVANQDDGVEWFGGTVNVTNVLVWDNGDDALDTDQDWQGTVDNVITISPAGSTMELDGPEGSGDASGIAHTIQNVTAYAETVGSELIDVDDNTNVNVNNVLFFGLATDEDGAAANAFSSDYDAYTQQSGDFAVTSIEAILPDGTDLADYFPQSLIEDEEVTSVADVGSASVGADVSVFGWTWASSSGTLSDIGLE